jgi:hypothetical protein
MKIETKEDEFILEYINHLIGEKGIDNLSVEMETLLLQSKDRLERLGEIGNLKQHYEMMIDIKNYLIETKRDIRLQELGV